MTRRLIYLILGAALLWSPGQASVTHAQRPVSRSTAVYSKDTTRISKTAPSSDLARAKVRRGGHLDQGGEDVFSATQIPGLPFFDTGTTIGFMDDYDEACPDPGGSADVVYSYLPLTDETLDISLCNGSDYDTKLFVYEDIVTPGLPYACGDDECEGMFSEILGMSVTGGVWYYIVIDGSAGAEGNYVLDITASTGCSIECSPTAVPEGEPQCADEYEDVFNGGCNSLPEVFSPLDCGSTVCGESGTFLVAGVETRDTDWYEIYVEDTASNFSAEVVAEFDAAIYLMQPGPGLCADYVTLSYLTAAPCDTAVTNIGCLDPGNYWLVVTPTGYTGVPCGAQYQLIVSCDPCPPPPANDECADAELITGEVSQLFSTLGATTDGPDEPLLCVSGGDTQVGSDIWYCYTAECDGNVTVSLCGSSYDTKLALYDTDAGCICPVVESAIACNDDFCGVQSEISFPAVECANYLIRIGGWNGQQGDGVLTISSNPICPQETCVNVGYIQLTPSDGWLNRYGRISTVAVELTNLECTPSTVSLTISDCEESVDYNVLLDGYSCELVNLPFAWTPNEECQPNYISVAVNNDAPGCIGNPETIRPLPIPRTPYQMPANHDGIPSGNSYQPPGSFPVAVKLTPVDYPCTVEYVRLTMAGDDPDTTRDPVDVVIWDDDGASETPGTVLAQIDGLVTRELDDWFIYAVPEIPVDITDGSFYVGFHQASHCDPLGTEAIAADAAYDNPLTTYIQIGISWLALFPPGDLMVDAYMRCPCPTTGSSPAMGYDYITNADPLGPIFEWVDVTVTGTAWSDSCPTCTPKDIPFAFPFDGSYQSRLKISLNGFLSFLDAGLGSGHMLMPDGAYPNSVVAPLWTESELCINYSGEVYYHFDPLDSVITVQWDNILAQETDRLSFEAMLYPSGEILFQYMNEPSYLDYSVGLENSDGTEALVVYQEGGCPPVDSGFAVLFTPTSVPDGPQQLTIIRDSAVPSNIVLRWEALAPEPLLYYGVYRSADSDFVPPGEGTFLGSTTTTSFVDTPLQLMDKAFYVVVASNTPPGGGMQNVYR